MSQIRDKKAHRKHIATMTPINAKSVQLIELHAFAYCLLSVSLSESFDFLKKQDGQGVNNRRTYKNIPFYLSSRMYGTFYHTCAHSKLSLAGHSTRSVQFLSDQALLDVFVIGGDTMEDILRGYRDLTGYPSMPPLWSFGVWMSRMTYFSADEVDEICDRMRAEHYPCDVIHLDTGWFGTECH